MTPYVDKNGARQLKARQRINRAHVHGCMGRSPTNNRTTRSSQKGQHGVKANFGFNVPSFTKKGEEGRALFKIGDLRLSRKRAALLSKAPFRGRHIDGYHPLPTSNIGPTLIGRETSQALLEPSKLKAPLVDISSAS